MTRLTVLVFMVAFTPVFVRPLVYFVGILLRRLWPAYSLATYERQRKSAQRFVAAGIYLCIFLTLLPFTFRQIRLWSIAGFYGELDSSQHTPYIMFVMAILPSYYVYELAASDLPLETAAHHLSVLCGALFALTDVVAQGLEDVGFAYGFGLLGTQIISTNFVVVGGFSIVRIWKDSQKRLKLISAVVCHSCICTLVFAVVLLLWIIARFHVLSALSKIISIFVMAFVIGTNLRSTWVLNQVRRKIKKSLNGKDEESGEGSVGEEMGRNPIS